MSRLLAVLGLALFLAQGVGALSPQFESICVERCSDDDAEGHCPPTCGDCLDCLHVLVRNIIAPNAVASPILSTAQRHQPLSETLPRSSEPEEILHVPKLRLA